MLNGKNILITGGTGEFSKKFVEIVLRDYPGVNKIIIYSRGEAAQYSFQQQYPVKQYPQLRFFIGDVRDRERLIRACSNVDVLIHAAGFSQVSTAEYNPDECVKTSIYGAQNVIDAALMCNVENIISLSSDKASSPINIYGATKLLADKLFVAANNLAGNKKIKFSVVRYGNILGARGSVVPYFLERKSFGAKSLPITDKRMTRFNITLQSCVDIVLFAISKQLGGEIFVPKSPSYHITDIAEAIAPEMEINEIGIRPGEKLHESLITSDEAYSTIELNNCYIILPSISYSKSRQLENYLEYYNAVRVPENFSYTSNNNTIWDTVETLRSKIRQYVNPSFKL